MSTAATTPSPGDGPAPAARVLGRWAAHPLLLAVQPALALWASNVAEATPGEVAPALWWPLLGVVVVWVVATPAVRSVRRGAVVAAVAAVVVLNGGQVWSSPGPVALVLAGALVLAAGVLARRLRDGALVPLTAIANVLAVVLVVLPATTVLGTWHPFRSSEVSAREGGDGQGLAGRDIWYVVPDRYPRADTLRTVFGYDNTPFLSHLEGLGFQVADRSLANYPKTAHSLAATWNMAPIEDLVPTPPADGGDWQPLYRLLRDSELGRVVTEAGYEYLHLGTWWSPTATSVSADRTLRVDTDSEFVSVWRTLTLLPAPSADGGGTDAEDGAYAALRERHRRYTSYQLDQLDRLAAEPHDQPRFVLAHVTLPHEPYVFEADGSPVTAQEAASRSREENVLNHLAYVNRRLTDLVDTLTSGPPETWPVIVIQSDEGPHPVARTGPAYDWTTAPVDVLEEKLRTLSAILLPGSDAVLPEDLTGIDTWRYVLDATIGTDYGPVADPPVEVFPGEDDLYTLVDVAPRVD